MQHNWIKIFLAYALFFLSSQQLNAHGVSDISGEYSIFPENVKEGDDAVLKLHLQETTAGIIDATKFSAKLKVGDQTEYVTFTKTAAQTLEAPFKVRRGRYDMRIYAERGDKKEVALLGFDVNDQLQELQKVERELWLAPAGRFEAIAWLDNFAGAVVALFLLGISFWLVRKSFATSLETTSAPIYALALAALAAVATNYGAFWDVSFHAVSGRESFFSAPHLLIYGGITATLMALVLAAGRKSKGTSWRQHLQKDNAIYFAFVAACFQLSSAPFDELWHNLFGLDVSIWSPPHAILIVGTYFVLLALANVRTASGSQVVSALRLLILGASLLVAEVFLAEYNYPFPKWHISQARPELLYPLFLALFAITTGVVCRSLGTLEKLRFGLSVTVAIFILLRLLLYPWLNFVGMEVMPEFSGWLLVVLAVALVFDLVTYVRVRGPNWSSRVA